MKKIDFSAHVLPHIIAVAVFLIVTVFFFRPIFFDNKNLQQHDIEEWEGSSKELRDFRKQTGEEGLWANAMFSGMPAYLINVEWSNKGVVYLKKVISLALPHPIANVFIAFVCYYILLLTFGVRPYLAIGGAIAFGLSTYMIIGLSAGHNARIGAIAFMPLVMAGIHLVFSNKRLLGFGLTSAAFALHLRENHIQITYYLAIIILVYGLVQLIYLHKQKQLATWAKNVGLLVPAILIAIGTFVGPLWSITQYTTYSTRGKSELVPVSKPPSTGMTKEYAFEFSNGILEPMTLLIPNFYGGASANFLVQDPKSETYKVLMGSGNEQMANQLANYTSAYWGPQRLAAPYYAGAIVIFLFAIGVAFGDKKMLWWLVPLTVFSIVLSWGKNFESLNYFLFDYLPGYNKFRSVTFALVIALFSMPLLAFTGLEKFLFTAKSKETRKKLFIVLGVTGGLCLLTMLLSGMLTFMRDVERDLPPWFTTALADDRQGLLTSDAFRSLAFIVAVFTVLYFEVWKKISPLAFYGFLIVMIVADLAVVNKRYLKDENFKRKRDNTTFVMNEVDQEILKDKSYYRVYNLESPLTEARTSYFHNSIGGYHGAKLQRYQDVFDSCLYKETERLFKDAQTGQLNFISYGVINMLNVKYIFQRTSFIPNPAANGNSWFVNKVVTVNSPNEELQKLCEINTRSTAVIDASKFKVAEISTDTTATVKLLEHKPNYLKYESNSSAEGLAVFSEIYYEKGWKAFIDHSPAEILRANYILRALAVPSGKHTIEFKFEPTSYYTGNTITAISSWLMVVVLLGCIGLTLKREDEKV